MNSSNAIDGTTSKIVPPIPGLYIPQNIATLSKNSTTNNSNLSSYSSSPTSALISEKSQKRKRVASVETVVDIPPNGVESHPSSVDDNIHDDQDKEMDGYESSVSINPRTEADVWISPNTSTLPTKKPTHQNTIISGSILPARSRLLSIDSTTSFESGKNQRSRKTKTIKTIDAVTH